MRVPVHKTTAANAIAHRALDIRAQLHFLHARAPHQCRRLDDDDAQIAMQTSRDEMSASIRACSSSPTPLSARIIGTIDSKQSEITDTVANTETGKGPKTEPNEHTAS
jgi:hypothetical protein